MARHRHLWPLSMMCRMFGVTRAGFYAWLGRPQSARAQSNQQLSREIRRRRRPVDAGPRLEHTIALNLLDWEFAASVPNCKWAGDFTYIWTQVGWLYVAAMMDLFSRRIVGWSMNSQMAAQLVTDAMLMAIRRCGPRQALLAHSDQGSQYTSEQFQRLLADHGVTCSMSRSGDCWDNASVESLFSTLKTERTNAADRYAVDVSNRQRVIGIGYCLGS